LDDSFQTKQFLRATMIVMELLPNGTGLTVCRKRISQI